MKGLAQTLRMKRPPEVRLLVLPGGHSSYIARLLRASRNLLHECDCVRASDSPIARQDFAAE